MLIEDYPVKVQLIFKNDENATVIMSNEAKRYTNRIAVTGLQRILNKSKENLFRVIVLFSSVQLLR